MLEYTLPMAGPGKKLGFTFLTAAVLLGAAEFGLRFTMPDLEDVVSPLIYQRNSGQAFVPGDAPGSRTYVSGRQRVVSNKAPGKRVLVFGASAAFGEMFSPFTAFPGQAEQLLRDAAPSVPIEILNLAHGGMGSRQVAEMVFRALENDNPDLIVVNTGNNEYHELRALKARSDRYDPKAELLRRRLSASYLYRQLRDWFMPAETATSFQGQDDWLPIGRMDVTVDQDDRELGRRLYKEHLQNVVLAAKDRGIPVLLTTVASNTRGHLDNGTPGKPTEAEQKALHELHGMAGSVPKARFTAEASARMSLIQTESGWHKLGNLYLKVGMVEIAADAFERKELAALRPMTSNRALRDVVKNLNKRHGVAMCDLAGALAQVSEHGIPGDEHFIDHCHPNADGHFIMGRALAVCILKQDLLDLGQAAAPEWIQAQALTGFENPFRVDHFSGHRPIPGSKTNLTPGDPSTAEGQALRGHQAFVAERYDHALQAYQEAQSLGGDAPSLDVSMGLTHLFRGDMTAAKVALQRAVDGGSTDAEAHLAAL